MRRIEIPARLPLMLVVAALVGLCQTGGPVSWGTAADGVRLGVGLGADETVRLVFRNTGEVEKDLLLGGLTGIGPTYSMEFASRGADGQDCKVFLGGAGHMAGYLEPIVVRLVPGGRYELSLPLARFGCSIDRENVALKKLLRQGRSIRASLKVTADAAKWSGSQQAWIGRVVSGDFVLPPGAP